MIRKRKKQPGQGMLELIVAIGVIVSSVISTLGLVISTKTTSEASSAAILAANLAREGIEVVRGVRDGNWLAIDAGYPGSVWNKNLYTGAAGSYDYTAIASFEPAGGGWQLLFNENALGDPRTEVYQNPGTGVFTQFENSGSFSGFAKINYWRLVSMAPVCWYVDPATDIEVPPNGTHPEQIVPEGSSGDCVSLFGPDYREVGVQVRSRVRWVDHKRTNNIDLVEKIFNWKP